MGASIATVSNNEPGEDVSNAEDEERWYEHSMRPRLGSELEDLGAERLPVKLGDGSIQSRGHLPLPPSDSESDSELDENLKEQSSNLPKVEDVATGARFGRPAVAAVIGTKSRKVRIQLAKEQIAGLCQDIVSDPENSVRRFCPLCYDGNNLLTPIESLVFFEGLAPLRYPLSQPLPNSGPSPMIL